MRTSKNGLTDWIYRMRNLWERFGKLSVVTNLIRSIMISGKEAGRVSLPFFHRKLNSDKRKMLREDDTALKWKYRS